MCVKFNLLFDREMKVYFVTQVLKQDINNKMSPNYILEFTKKQNCIYCKSILVCRPIGKLSSKIKSVNL